MRAAASGLFYFEFPMKALDRILESARRQPMRIALCEADDPRVLHAAARATRDGIARIVLVGDRAAIHAAAARDALDLDGMTLVDPATAPQRDAYADALHALRKAKGMTADAARDAVLDPLCHANLMVRLGDADGSVAGAVHATADVVRAAIQLIGVDPAFRIVSSFFLMMLCEPFHTIKGGLIFSDCALVVDPDAGQLAEIAMAAADSAHALLGEAPRVAMLSFSTSGSAHHAAVDKVTAATARACANCARRSRSTATCSSTRRSSRKSPSARSRIRRSAATRTCSCSRASKPATSATSSPSGSAAQRPSARCCRACAGLRTTCRAAAAPTTCIT
ncbi:phosphate acetyl/butyryl transferase [Burkholderia cenocepacia K56-2Valvano]|nr:phosphate acetyl/butyryl transferase [Burkholderia cenocepacia K56-2Valvano]